MLRQEKAAATAQNGDASGERGDGRGAGDHGALLLARAQEALTIGHPTGGRLGVQAQPGPPALPALTPPAPTPPAPTPPALTQPAAGSFASMLDTPGAPEVFWGHAGGGTPLGLGGEAAAPLLDNSWAMVPGLGATMQEGAVGDRGFMCVGAAAIAAPAPGGKGPAQQQREQQRDLHFQLACQAAAGAGGMEPEVAARRAVERAQQLDCLIEAAGEVDDAERNTLRKTLRIFARLVQPGRSGGIVASIIAEAEEGGAGLAELPKAAKDWQTLVKSFGETMARLTMLITYFNHTGQAVLSTAAAGEKVLVSGLWKELEDCLSNGSKYGTLRMRLLNELAALCRQDGDHLGFQAIFNGKEASATGTAAAAAAATTAAERFRKLSEEHKELKAETQSLRKDAKLERRAVGAGGAGAGAAQTQSQ